MTPNKDDLYAAARAAVESFLMAYAASPFAQVTADHILDDIMDLLTDATHRIAEAIDTP